MDFKVFITIYFLTSSEFLRLMKGLSNAQICVTQTSFRYKLSSLPQKVPSCRFSCNIYLRLHRGINGYNFLHHRLDLPALEICIRGILWCILFQVNFFYCFICHIDLKIYPCYYVQQKCGYFYSWAVFHYGNMQIFICGYPFSS